MGIWGYLWITMFWILFSRAFTSMCIPRHRSVHQHPEIEWIATVWCRTGQISTDWYLPPHFDSKTFQVAIHFTQTYLCPGGEAEALWEYYPAYLEALLIRSEWNSQTLSTKWPWFFGDLVEVLEKSFWSGPSSQLSIRVRIPSRVQD